MGADRVLTHKDFCFARQVLDMPHKTLKRIEDHKPVSPFLQKHGYSFISEYRDRMPFLGTFGTIIPDRIAVPYQFSDTAVYCLNGEVTEFVSPGSSHHTRVVERG